MDFWTLRNSLMIRDKCCINIMATAPPFVGLTLMSSKQYVASTKINSFKRNHSISAWKYIFRNIWTLDRCFQTISPQIAFPWWWASLPCQELVAGPLVRHPGRCAVTQAVQDLLLHLLVLLVRSGKKEEVQVSSFLHGKIAFQKAVYTSEISNGYPHPKYYQNEWVKNLKWPYLA